MEIMITSGFLAVIVMVTVFQFIKLFKAAYEKGEITQVKLHKYILVSSTAGLVTAVGLPLLFLHLWSSITG
ncbi:hypothetical protein [Halobacillus sp. A5]|uniref:hypothetical protein n=1 Tax=Halobacillus sp. A5 TaxID=2880263 RepID=UPI0020A6C920|nr:hypothetical protein [Halobacillus sp. A5]MCP3027148.1 hypothetical protein [Halobacillus sp. A5]